MKVYRRQRQNQMIPRCGTHFIAPRYYSDSLTEFMATRRIRVLMLPCEALAEHPGKHFCRIRIDNDENGNLRLSVDNAGEIVTWPQSLPNYGTSGTLEKDVA